MNEFEFQKWLVDARPGASTVYHSGAYAFDSGARKEAWRACEAGLVLLTQRRVERSNDQGYGARFDYVATRATPK